MKSVYDEYWECFSAVEKRIIWEHMTLEIPLTQLAAEFGIPVNELQSVKAAIKRKVAEHE